MHFETKAAKTHQISASSHIHHLRDCSAHATWNRLPAREHKPMTPEHGNSPNAAAATQTDSHNCQAETHRLADNTTVQEQHGQH